MKNKHLVFLFIASLLVGWGLKRCEFGQKGPLEGHLLGIDTSLLSEFSYRPGGDAAITQGLVTLGERVRVEVSHRDSPMRSSSVRAASDWRRRCADVITGIAGASAAFWAAMKRSIASRDV